MVPKMQAGWVQTITSVNHQQTCLVSASACWSTWEPVNFKTANRALQRAQWANVRAASETGRVLTSATAVRARALQWEGLAGLEWSNPQECWDLLWTLEKMCQDSLLGQAPALERSCWRWNQDWTGQRQERGREKGLHQSGRREHRRVSSESSCQKFWTLPKRQKRELCEVRKAFLKPILF